MDHYKKHIPAEDRRSLQSCCRAMATARTYNSWHRNRSRSCRSKNMRAVWDHQTLLPGKTFSVHRSPNIRVEEIRTRIHSCLSSCITTLAANRIILLPSFVPTAELLVVDDPDGKSALRQLSGRDRIRQDSVWPRTSPRDGWGYSTIFESRQQFGVLFTGRCAGPSELS